MSGGRFFNSLGYGQGTPNIQSNNSSNNNNNGNFGGGTPGMMGNNPMQSAQQIPGNPMNPVSSMSPMNPMANGNPMNNGMFINKDLAANQYAGPLHQDPVPPMGGRGNPMNSGMTGATQSFLGNQQIPMNSMNQGNPMGNNGSMSTMKSNPMNQGNLMNQDNPMNNGMFINKDLAANQYAGPLHQDPVSPMGGRGNPMNSGMTCVTQSFLGNQQTSMNSMNQGNPMNSNPMNQGNPMGNNGSMSTMKSNPMNQGNPMNQSNLMNSIGGYVNPMNQGNPMNPINNGTPMDNQQTIMMNSNDGPNFNNSLNAVNEMGNPIAQPMPQSDLSIKPKLKFDIKKLFIIGAVVSILIVVILCLACSKTVTCTREDTIQGAKVETSMKVSYWFNKIIKIETKVTWDMSGLDSKSKDILKKTYEELDDGSKVEITDNKIVISKINKPTDKDKESGADKVSPNELIEDYESSGLTCK